MSEVSALRRRERGPDDGDAGARWSVGGSVLAPVPYTGIKGVRMCPGSSASTGTSAQSSPPHMTSIWYSQPCRRWIHVILDCLRAPEVTLLAATPAPANECAFRFQWRLVGRRSDAEAGLQAMNVLDDGDTVWNV